MSFRSTVLLTATIFSTFFLLVRGVESQVPAGAPGTLTVLAKEGRRAIPTTVINDQEFAALDDLASAFQLVMQEQSGAVTVSYKGKTIIITPDQALASVSGRLVSLPAAPVRQGRRWFVPLEFISRALSSIYDVRLDLRKPAHLLVVGDMRAPRLAARYEPFGSAARLTIDATPRTASTVSQDGSRLTIRFDADAIDAPNPVVGPQPPASLVQSVSVTDPVTITVELGSRAAGVRSSTEQTDSSTRLVIDLVAAPPTETGGAPASPTAPAAPAPAELPPAFGAPTSPIRTIAIDPGHGGEDEGVKGPNGSMEKDVTLAVAQRLKAAIESRLGIRVLLTRDADRMVDVDERTAIANNNKADLFISLHANGSLRSSTTGATIFSTSLARDAAQAAKNIEAPERLQTFGGGLRDIELVPWDLAQTRHLDQSIAFARILEEELHNRVPIGSPGLDQAPLRVLQSANMPAVLVEIGFLTNPGQETALSGAEFQAAFALGVYNSIVRFRDTLAAGEGK